MSTQASHSGRLEDRRRIRNNSNSSSQLGPRGLVTTGPSLPDTTIVPNVDNWNNDGIQVARRPRPVHPPALDVALNNPRVDVPLVHGPPPPRSWVNPTPRTNASNQTRRRTTSNKPPVRGTHKIPKKSAPAMTVVERLKLHEEEQLMKAYAEEYWFRAADDARWSAWREEALRIVFSYSAGNSEVGKRVLEEMPFTTFNVHGEDSRMPTLFETVLRFIFSSSAPNNPSVNSHDEDLDFDSVEVIQVLPPHIQKRALRYAAAHKPLDQDQLGRIYMGAQDEGLRSEDVDPQQIIEVILSGRKVEGGVLEQLLERLNPRDSASSTTPTVSPLQSIILFQTPFIQKRLLNSFPKTLTTLGLIALPPPKGMLQERTTTNSVSISVVPGELPTIHQCSCPWCASYGIGSPSSSSSNTRPRPSSSTSHSPPSISSAPHSSVNIIQQLIDLPTLLPSLVILDVSYNPWMTLDSVLRSPNLKHDHRKGRIEHAGIGIFGTWDLRLWGRMKVLALRGCFEYPSESHAAGGGDVDDQLLGGDLLPDLGSIHSPVSVPHCACGIPQSGHVGWTHRDALLKRWEKTMYSVGRSIKFIWREHECRCGAVAS